MVSKHENLRLEKRKADLSVLFAASRCLIIQVIVQPAGQPSLQGFLVDLSVVKTNISELLFHLVRSLYILHVYYMQMHRDLIAPRFFLIGVIDPRTSMLLEFVTMEDWGYLSSLQKSQCYSVYVETRRYEGRETHIREEV